jgi:hypothetical protein
VGTAGYNVGADRGAEQMGDSMEGVEIAGESPLRDVAV